MTPLTKPLGFPGYLDRGRAKIALPVFSINVEVLNSCGVNGRRTLK